ncbi:MAG: methyltransferase domain-containing protein, partial [Gemmatimonadetes bacterium]|nr:methyltransferase domain-containing protein [Gemmatimonadota bacterium]
GAGERVLDLGAGTGLSARTAARRGARATALDHDPLALELVAAAAALQGLAVEARRFDLAGDEPLPPADTVVLADVLYEPALARAAARRVAEAVARGARALVGDPGRLARAEFVATLRAAGLDVAFDEVTAAVPGERTPATVALAWIGG